jgi:hypothetical protein
LKKLLIFILFLTSCGKWTSLRWGEGASLKPTVEALAVTQKQVTIKGFKLDDVTKVIFKTSSKESTSWQKEFKVTFQSLTDLIAIGIDNIKIPTNVPLEMILSTASADESFPIFSPFRIALLKRTLWAMILFPPGR